MLCTLLNKTWKQHPTKQQLFSNLPPLSRTIQIGETKLTGDCKRSKDELKSVFLLWTPTHEQSRRPVRGEKQ